MDQAPSIFSFPALLAFLLFISIALKITRKITNSNASPYLPPGPWKLPIIGNLHQLVGSGPLPHLKLANLAKKYGPLMRLQMGEVTNIVVSSPEMAKEILKTQDIYFAQRPHIQAVQIITYNFANLVFAPYGEYWRQLRKICTTELLSAKRVRSFQWIREEEALHLLCCISSNEGSVVNLSELLDSSSSSLIAKAAFGKECKDQDAFVHALHQVTRMAGGLHITDLFPSAKWLHLVTGTLSKLKKLHNSLDTVLQSILDQHKIDAKKASNGLEDDGDQATNFVDVLLNIQRQENAEFALTDTNIKAVIMDMFGAGAETTSTTLQWVMSELVKNPRVMNKAQEELRQALDGKRWASNMNLDQLEYFNCVIKEAMRLHPPLPLIVSRECREQRRVDAYEIPPKTRVTVNLWALGRDPNYWNEPESFHPERFLGSAIGYVGAKFEYLPFGAGRRMCPGVDFGIASVQFMLVCLLYHFDWRLPNGASNEELDMAENYGGSIKRKIPLCLVPVARRPIASTG